MTKVTDYTSALHLVFGRDTVDGYNTAALSRLDHKALESLLSDNCYPAAIEAMAAYARTFTVVMPQYERLAAWLASYAWGYGHLICLAQWGEDAAVILRMMGRHAAMLGHRARSVHLPEQLTLYRGQLHGKALGWSWTLDREWAETFLVEWGYAGQVLELSVTAGHVLAVICDHADRNGHDEYIIDPVYACRYFPQFQPMDASVSQAMIDDDFPAFSTLIRKKKL
jgi:hypothetical protein